MFVFAEKKAGTNIEEGVGTAGPFFARATGKKNARDLSARAKSTKEK